MRGPELGCTGGLLVVIPLIFTSSAVVPVATFPGWLQALAEASPMTVAAGALLLPRLCAPADGHLWQALGWITAVLARRGPGCRLTTAT